MTINRNINAMSRTVWARKNTAPRTPAMSVKRRFDSADR
jgi:hypothetical protein